MCSPLSSGIFVPATEACTGHDAETAASWPMQVAHISIRSAAYLINDCLAGTRILGEHISAFKSGNVTPVPRGIAVSNQQQPEGSNCGPAWMPRWALISSLNSIQAAQTTGRLFVRIARYAEAPRMRC